MKTHFEGQADWDQFKALIAQVSTIPDKRQQIQAYNQQTASVRAQLETYRKMVSGDRVDVTTAKAQLQTLQTDLQRASDQLDATSKLYILNQKKRLRLLKMPPRLFANRHTTLMNSPCCPVPSTAAVMLN
ncbi:hypothetical protein [Secundilactobacillus collinoides]|uniref:hypothetical protein n=1 Tax=Secundilactobacillus collinoides TaxID=33960 RepID=UPI0015848146|nr:hypothetical protein [Secundilactobacillus collinoides]